MVELEVKVLNVNLEDMEERLLALGAEKIQEEVQENIIFDSPSLWIERDLDAYLRIRDKKSLLTGEKSMELTLKENIEDSKIRRNKETNIDINIDDKEAIIELLGKLGLEVKSIGRKHRISYRWENFRFDLDSWDRETYPHPYMEIEMAGPEDLERAINLLGLKREDITRKSIRDLQRDLEK